ncbi:MAG: hypothetical protein FWD14_05040 [Treponema sp.]|nr:hypothetical protein [Treponema sp.]
MGYLMEFRRLNAAFYTQYAHCEEILTKEKRPYYVLVLELDYLTYAIPLRSHITHPFCYIADSSNEQKRGLDYSKAVVISDLSKYTDSTPVTIRQHEYNILKQKEYQIKQRFSFYVKSYKKEVQRRKKIPTLPDSSLCRFSTLRYFHKELGI